MNNLESKFDELLPKMYGSFLVVSIIGCILLVLNSAWSINKNLFLIVLVFILVINSTLRRYRVKGLMLTRLLLLIISFMQTMMWVYDYNNPIHEPRSVFIITMVAVTTYYMELNLKETHNADETTE